MDFSEFKRRLGAEPRSTEDDLLRARASGPEFEKAAAEAQRFEDTLERALDLPVPAEIAKELGALATRPPRSNRLWRPFALAAGLLIAVGAASLVWRAQHSWDSVEDYVMDHYRHDGVAVLSRADGGAAEGVAKLLAEFRVQADPRLATMIDVIKVCPTPDGKGVHMVLDGPGGPFTVIYMPRTAVTDGETLNFDGMEAMLVQLPSGSAVVIGNKEQGVPAMYALLHDSIRPLDNDALSNNS